MSQNDSQEPVTVTDKRRIDPTTGEMREPASGAAPDGSAPEAATEASDEAAELKQTLQRVKAEYDNYRKRSMREQQASADRAKATVVTQLLPILDDLDRARSHGDLEAGPLKSVADKLTAALDGVGLAAFGVEGDVFDPILHEAVQHDGDGSNPVLGTVMRQGYRLGEQVLRHALVGVVDAPEGSSGPDTAQNSGGSADEATESQ
ncbi:MAG: nucleotide exchange factor GrpE [Mycobacterium sp.]